MTGDSQTLKITDGGGRACAVLLWGVSAVGWWALVVQWIDGGSAWLLLASAVVLAPGLVLGWRLWSRRLVVTEAGVEIRNTFTRVVVPRSEIMAVEIVPDEWAGWAVGFRVTSRPGLIRSGVLAPALHVSVRSHEAFRLRVDQIARILGLPPTSGAFARARSTRVSWPEIVLLLTISVVVFSSNASLSTRISLGSLPLALAVGSVLAGFIRR